jgi:hypothetical protein
VAIVVVSLGFAAVAVRRRYFASWFGAAARLAEVVIGLTLLIVELELLGAAGAFRLGPIVVASLLVGAVAAAIGGRSYERPRGVPLIRPMAIRRLDRARVPDTISSGPEGVVATVIALLGAAAVLARWTASVLSAYDHGIRSFDSLWYHLPWAATFAQTGHITPLKFTDVEYLTAFYPATAELFHGLGIVLLGRDTLSPAINLVWLALTLLAAWCIGRPRRCAPATMLGATLALAVPAIVGSQAGSAANDIVAVFFLLAAVALAGTDRDDDAALVLAAIAAGFAVGTKLNLLAPVLALTIGVIATAPAGRRLTSAALWLVPLVLAGGFWYARNLIAVGNPLPWTSLGVLPTPDPPLQQQTGFSIVHYLTNTHVWSEFFEPGLASGLGPWWVVIVAAALLGPLLCLVRGRDRTVRMLGFVALASTLGYLVTPEGAAGPAGDPIGFAFNIRYAAPALTLSLAVLPLAPILQGPRRQLLTVLALAAMLVATLAQARFWPAPYTLTAVAVAAAILLGGLLVAGLRRLRPGRMVALGGVVILVLAAAVAGFAGQQHYLRVRYVFTPGINLLGRTWALFRDVRDARVGVGGTFGSFFSYPFYGLDTSNHVQYIARQGPHGSFTPITTCRDWRAAVNAGHYQYLVTTPSRNPWQPTNLGPSPEGEWTASDPSARVIFKQRGSGQLFTVFRLDGPLDPAGCP